MAKFTYLHGTVLMQSVDRRSEIRFCPPVRAKFGGSSRCAIYRDGRHVKTFAKLETAAAAI